MIEIKNLSYSYNRNKNQLDDVNLTIAEGEVVVITGPSGSGKSTLTKVINGLIPYFFGGEITGDVSLDGEDLGNLATWERSFLIGNVFQDPRSQFFCNEVAGEIAFGCENLGLSHEEIKSRVDFLSKELGLEDTLFDAVRTLSFGTRQKIAIASAKATDPKIYVMDEPSANLDMQSTYHLAEQIKMLKEKGKTVFIAEHRLYYLKGIADRILYVNNGKIQESFTESEMLAMDEDKIASLGIRHMSLEEIKNSPSVLSNKGAEVLSIQNIHKSFQGKTVLHDINFTCKAGETVAIVGPNSSGKSTLGKLISGLLKEDCGAITYRNKKIKSKHRLENIWYVSQDLDTQLFAESVFLELVIGKKPSQVIEKKALDILTRLHLIEFKDKHPSSLSGGQKQRLTIGVALMNEAKVIILDEPTSGLDAQNMHNVSNLIKEISSDGTTILMITHDIECAMETCHRVLHLVDGRIASDKQITDSKSLIDMCMK